MTAPLIVDVPGPCVSWQRTTSMQGRRLTPARQRAYQAHVRACAWAARAMHPAPPRLDGRMSVRVLVCAADLRQRDVDNAAKTVLDACNRVLWSDDAQVDVLSVERIAYTYNDTPMELRRGFYVTNTHHYHNALN